MPPTRLVAILSFFLNPQIGQSLICYDCPSYGAECARPGDENFGELLECPDSPRAACVSIHRLTVIRRTHSIINYQNMAPYFSRICVFRTQISANYSKSGVQILAPDGQHLFVLFLFIFKFSIQNLILLFSTIQYISMFVQIK